MHTKHHMEVVGSDGVHVGIIDHLDGDRLKLINPDSNASGQEHFLPLTLIAKVDGCVTLSVTAANALARWETKAR